MNMLSRRRLVRGFVKTLHAHPTTRAKLTQQLAGYLVASRRAKDVDLLLRDMATEVARVEGHMLATVESAARLDPGARRAITGLLQKATGATTIELHESINPDLIGGGVVHTPHYRLDASIATQLQRLTHLTGENI